MAVRLRSAVSCVRHVYVCVAQCHVCVCIALCSFSQRLVASVTLRSSWSAKHIRERQRAGESREGGGDSVMVGCGLVRDKRRRQSYLLERETARVTVNVVLFIRRIGHCEAALGGTAHPVVGPGMFAHIRIRRVEPSQNSVTTGSVSWCMVNP